MDILQFDYRKTPIAPELIVEKILAWSEYEVVYDLSNGMDSQHVEVSVILYLKEVIPEIGSMNRHLATIRLTETQYNEIAPILRTFKEL